MASGVTRADIAAECDTVTAMLPGILAVIVATADGMLIHSNWTEMEGMRAAAVAATALGLGQHIASEFGEGAYRDSVITTGDRAIGIYAVGHKHVLGVVAASAEVSLGRLHHVARKAADRLATQLVPVQTS